VYRSSRGYRVHGYRSSTEVEQVYRCLTVIVVQGNRVTGVVHVYMVTEVVQAYSGIGVVQVDIVTGGVHGYRNRTRCVITWYRSSTGLQVSRSNTGLRMYCSSTGVQGFRCSTGLQGCRSGTGI
jgi:hypothetical protein